MHLRSTIGSLLIVLCLGGSSNLPVSSISVNRDDVPVSYKYKAIRIHSTEKPTYNNIRPQLSIEYTTPLFKSIQFDPTIVKNKEKNILYYRSFILNQNKTHSITHRETTKNYTRQLEPREYSNNNNFSITTSVPEISGYNIDLSILNKMKYGKGSLLNHPNNDNQITKIKKSPVLNLNIDVKETLRSKILRNIIEKSILRDGKSIKTVQVLLAMGNAQIQPAIAYAQMPYLHLNVARSFNVARTPYKAQRNEYIQKYRHKTLKSKSLFYSIPNIINGFS